MKESHKSSNALKTELLAVMRQQLFSPRNSLGQNFLIDREVFDRIIEQLSPDKNDALVEIGMGPGLLSRELALRAGMYLGCEIDNRFKAFHAEVFSGLKMNAYFLYEDALKADFGGFAEEIARYERLLVFSNLPYYITTDLILKMLCDFPQAEQMLFMIEKAALNRILARPGSKAYGPLAINSSLWGEWKELMNISGHSFNPAPRTTSSLYSLIANDESLYKQAASAPGFQNFSSAVLRNRRKTLANALMYTEMQEETVRKRLAVFLEEESLSDNVRAESLTAQQFVRLYTRVMDLR
ncbi:MAG: ribosomal RNA small subunit methyltransferase A [Clostridiaceae bacterium]|jgi:16S rRNA (adenine1518-N6/adenine1519-N6)-dimethyltransferase|nr:ribosomal RNA small subunit methyltransferase A [Clostridiaceae bacterium]